MDRFELVTKEQQEEMQKKGYFLLEPDQEGQDVKEHLAFDQ